MTVTSVVFDIFAKDRASSTFKHVGTSANESEGHLTKLRSTLIKVGAGFAAWEGARKGVEFLKSSTEAASQDQAAQRKLSLALQNTTKANGDQINGVQEWITKQSEALGISKDELMPAFQRLAESTGSVTKARKELTIAENVSAGTGKDLATVSTAIMKANNGTTSSLSRLGLKTKETTKNTAAIKAAQISAQTSQLAYTAAIKKYGAQSTQAKIAGEKLALAHKKVADAQKVSATTSLTLDQALHKMSDTFGGQAKAKAGSFDGTMQRLSTTWHEAKVQVGDALIPVLQKFGNWLLSTGVPAVQRFFHEFKNGEGTAGQLKGALMTTLSVFKAVGSFLIQHKSVLVAVVAAWVAWKAAVVANNTVQAISLVRLKMQTVGTVENAVATKASALASKAWAAAQWLVNAAMDANPIGLVVIAIAALVAGLVIAYKHSATFRAIVRAAFHGVQVAAKKVADFFTRDVPAAFNKVKNAASATIGWVKSHWPLILAILSGPFGIAVLLIAKNWGRIKTGASDTIHAVTGFFASLPGKIKTALGDLGKLLFDAGKQVVQGLMNGIQSMVSGLMSKVSGIAHGVSGAFKKGLSILSPSRVFIGHGVNIMKGLIQGIESQQIPLQTVLSKMVAAVQAAGAKLHAAMQARNQFAAGFQSFTSSAFGADLGTDASGNPTPVTAPSIIAYQKRQAAQARAVKVDVRKLVRMGLSPALIKQLQSAGASGIPEIQALASATPAQIRAYNRLNKQTTSDLHQAGMSAADRLFSQEIAHDRKAQAEVKHLLSEIRDAVKHGKTDRIEVTLDGHHVDFVLARKRRQNGGKLQSDKST